MMYQNGGLVETSPGGALVHRDWRTAHKGVEGLGVPTGVCMWVE